MSFSWIDFEFARVGLHGDGYARLLQRFHERIATRTQSLLTSFGA